MALTQTFLTMKNLSLLALISLLCIGIAHAESPRWQTKQGKPLTETEAMKSKNGFAGSVLAVTDADWKQKWETPPEITPSFNKAEKIGYDSKVFILIFFSNPGQNQQLISDIRCDLKIIDPTGHPILNKQDMACFSGQIAGSPYNQYLSAPVISFAADPGDPAGTWVIEVNLRDTIRQLELPLRTSFELTATTDGDDSLQAAANLEKQIAAMAKPMDATTVEPLPTETPKLEQDAPVSAAQPAVEKPVGGPENWAVNLIAYQQYQQAQAKAEEFTAKGIPAKVSEVAVKGETWYRLSVDGFKNQQQATSYAASAKKTLNLGSVWINRK